MLKTIRDHLYTEKFIEVTTPVLRKTHNETFPRVKLKEGVYLRDSMEMALRNTLRYYDKVYEIGPCFRNEVGTSIEHLPEFTMLELYIVDKNIQYLIDLTKSILTSLKSELQFEIVSIAQIIKTELDVDIFTASEDTFLKKIMSQYSLEENTPSYLVANKYIEDRIEPTSKGRCVCFVDYPTCTLSYANRKNGFPGVINRFEVFINGLEIAHAYEDETDLLSFQSRASEINLYGLEEEFISKQIEEGNLPRHTAGLGIGIERLCMALNEQENIKEFMFSKPFSIY